MVNRIALQRDLFLPRRACVTCASRYDPTGTTHILLTASHESLNLKSRSLSADRLNS
ncbi:Uncharacterised protein [Mycobacteroides abscessus subsp. abscessus]|nr:Uncharacterised protein [Mycobacteroides abscessus subsp. abscessus]